MYQFRFGVVCFQEGNVRILQGSHQSRRDHRESRWHQQSTTRGRSGRTVNHSLVHAQGFKKETPYDLIQTLRSTQTSWACTNDENINGTGTKQSVSSWPARGGVGLGEQVSRTSRDSLTYMSGCVILPCRISWKLGTRFNVLRMFSIKKGAVQESCFT